MIGLAAAEAMAVDVILERNDWQETMPGRGHARAGEWSDATATALCLAESLFEAGRFDLADQMERFLRWLRDGYPAKVRRSLRIDRQMAEALRFYEKNGNPYGGDCGHRDAGDGALVRLAPIAIVWQTNPALAIQRAGQQALTTNPGTISVDACRLLCALLLAALDGCPQEQILDWDRHPYRHLFRGEHALCAEIDAIAHGDYLDRSFDDLGHAGSAAGTLRRALLAFSKANFFRLGAKISAHNGSGLTGSAAVYGMLAGIVFGLDSDDTRRPQGIPEEMSGSLCEADLLLSHALRAYSVGSLPQLTELAPAKPIAVAIEDPIVSMLPVEGRLTPLGQGHRREYELRLFGRIPRINKFTLTDADSLGLVGRRRILGEFRARLDANRYIVELEEVFAQRPESDSVAGLQGCIVTVVSRDAVPLRDLAARVPSRYRSSPRSLQQHTMSFCGYFKQMTVDLGNDPTLLHFTIAEYDLQRRSFSETTDEIVLRSEDIEVQFRTNRSGGE